MEADAQLLQLQISRLGRCRQTGAFLHAFDGLSTATFLHCPKPSCMAIQAGVDAHGQFPLGRGFRTLCHPGDRDDLKRPLEDRWHWHLNAPVIRRIGRAGS